MMLDSLIKIFSLDIAILLGSPGILALAIILLSSKTNSKKKTIAFLTGVLAIGIIFVILGFFIGQAPISIFKPTLFHSIVDFILGVVFIVFGIKLLFSKHKRKLHLEKISLFKWMIIGLILSIMNFDAVLFLFTASREVGIAAFSSFVKFILLLINALFFVTPVLLPLFLYVIFPNTAAKICKKINYYVVKYGLYIVFIVFIIFGFLFLIKALEFFF